MLMSDYGSMIRNINILIEYDVISLSLNNNTIFISGDGPLWESPCGLSGNIPFNATLEGHKCTGSFSDWNPYSCTYNTHITISTKNCYGMKQESREYYIDYPIKRAVQKYAVKIKIMRWYSRSQRNVPQLHTLWMHNFIKKNKVKNLNRNPLISF
jgi:hypothetical protein